MLENFPNINPLTAEDVRPTPTLAPTTIPKEYGIFGEEFEPFPFDPTKNSPFNLTDPNTDYATKGNPESVQDAIIKADGSIIRTHPRDNLLATQNDITPIPTTQSSTMPDTLKLSEPVSLSMETIGMLERVMMDSAQMIVKEMAKGNRGGGIGGAKSFTPFMSLNSQYGGYR